jgi:DNA-binding Lrp family transcriptional regulator
VPPLDEHVNCCDDPAVRRRHNGCVVTGPDCAHGQRAVAESIDDAPDEPELTQPASALLTRNVAPPARSASVSWFQRSRGPEENTVVVQAYILIQTEVGKAASVAREIATLKGVTLAEDVTGPYDVIVRAEARNVDELGKLVVAKVQGIDGITRTLTCPVVHL